MPINPPRRPRRLLLAIAGLTTVPASVAGCGTGRIGAPDSGYDAAPDAGSEAAVAGGGLTANDSGYDGFLGRIAPDAGYDGGSTEQ